MKGHACTLLMEAELLRPLEKQPGNYLLDLKHTLTLTGHSAPPPWGFYPMEIKIQGSKEVY